MISCRPRGVKLDTEAGPTGRVEFIECCWLISHRNCGHLFCRNVVDVTINQLDVIWGPRLPGRVEQIELQKPIRIERKSNAYCDETQL